MKIKLTETQAKKLKIINENVDKMVMFEKLGDNIINEVNKYYVKVINASVSEILNGDVNIADIGHNLYKMSTMLHNGYMQTYSYLETLPEDKLEGLDTRVDDINSKASNKIDSMEIIISDLEKLKYTFDENNLTNVFGDMKPIDISNEQK